MTTQPIKQYTMFFRKSSIFGNVLISKNFEFNGSFREATERAQRHCSIIKAKYIFLQPFMADLADEEDIELHGFQPSHVNDTLAIEK